MTLSLSQLVSRVGAVLVVAGCATKKPAPSPTNAPASERAPSAPVVNAAKGSLVQLASDALIVLPAQSLRNSVSEWSDKVPDQRAFLSSLDDEIAFAVKERGVRGQWAFPADLARSARRNPGYTADPYALSMSGLVAVERDPDKVVGEPLAGQLRAFAGLFSARFAFVPVEVRLVSDASGGRGVLHAVVIDTRAAHLVWKGDVQGDATQNFSPAIAAGLASRVADLFITNR